MTVGKLFWPFVASLSVLGISSAYAQEAPSEEMSSNTSWMDNLNSETMDNGRWVWGMISESPLSNGVTYAIPDVSITSTFYVGGVGYLAVSRDSGANWQEVLSFSGFDSDQDEDEDDVDAENSGVDSARIAESRRDFIHQEIVDKYGSEDYADSILDNISDSELVEAQDLSDIEELEALELEMDSNLNHIPVQAVAAVDRAMASVSDYDTYVERYLGLIRRGAESDVAALRASESAAVWRIVSMPAATFAVTSENVYMTADHGENWDTFMTSTDGRYFLSMDISEDGKYVLVGTTRGILFTADGGETWEDVSYGLNGSIYEVHIMDGGRRFIAATTSGLYASDNGLAWYALPSLLSANELVLNLETGTQSRMLVLTTDGLYYADGEDWDEISYRPFGEESLRQVIARDESLSSFAVRTDAHVFEYQQGWHNQNNTLFAAELGHFAYLKDGISLGIMASPTGLWVAQDLSVIEKSPEYLALKEKWAREPSDELVLNEAIEAHYLGKDLERRWGLRSCMAWLLPRVDFDYIFNQTRDDNRKVVKNVMMGVDESDVWTSKRTTVHQWQIMAHWDFQIDRAHVDSVARESMLANLRDDRYALVKKVMDELNKRHAMEMTLLLDLPKLPEGASKSQVKSLVNKQVKAQLNLQEAESHLNYLTGGYYLPAIHGYKK